MDNRPPTPNKCHSADAHRARLIQSCAYKSRAWVVESLAVLYPDRTEPLKQLRETLDTWIAIPNDAIFDDGLKKFIASFTFAGDDMTAVAGQVMTLVADSHVACDSVNAATSKTGFTYVFPLCF